MAANYYFLGAKQLEPLHRPKEEPISSEPFDRAVGRGTPDKTQTQDHDNVRARCFGIKCEIYVQQLKQGERGEGKHQLVSVGRGS